MAAGVGCCHRDLPPILRKIRQRHAQPLHIRRIRRREIRTDGEDFFQNQRTDAGGQRSAFQAEGFGFREHAAKQTADFLASINETRESRVVEISAVSRKI